MVHHHKIKETQTITQATFHIQQVLKCINTTSLVAILYEGMVVSLRFQMREQCYLHSSK